MTGHGLAVSCADTLCKRALDEGQPFTSNVFDCWGDSEAAKALGIETYFSIPVRLGDKSLFGTLCAASTQSRLPSAEVERVDAHAQSSPDWHHSGIAKLRQLSGSSTIQAQRTLCQAAAQAMAKRFLVHHQCFNGDWRLSQASVAALGHENSI